MLAGIEGCHYLRSMQMMASGDDDCVDDGIVENLLLVSGAGSKSEFLGGVARMRTAGAQATTISTPPTRLIAGSRVLVAKLRLREGRCEWSLARGGASEGYRHGDQCGHRRHARDK